MAFYISDKASFQRLQTISEPPTTVNIYCCAAFLPRNEDFQLVFHNKLKSVIFRIESGGRNRVVAIAWLNGLKSVHSLVDFTHLSVCGANFVEDCYLPGCFPHLALSNPLTEFVQNLEFRNLVFGKTLVPLLTKSLPLFKTENRSHCCSVVLTALLEPWLIQ